MSELHEKFQSIVRDAKSIVIIQADNPDGDSVGTALALEEVLGDLGKETYLFCAVDIPTYLRYLEGWDRVSKELPKQFDASIIVDASTLTLLEKLAQSGELSWLATKPCVVLDHHAAVENVIPFASVIINDPTVSSTGELVYTLARQFQWAMSVRAQECIMTAILGDTQGLSNQLATEQTYRVMADMVAAGIDRPKLEDLRREYGKMPVTILRYKAKLIDRTQLSESGRVASVVIPQAEITQFSPLYNPAPLIQGDLLQTQDVAVAIVFKTYDDGRVTAAIRSNAGYPIAAKLATSMGGGGHEFASGFKDTSKRPADAVIKDCIQLAEQLVDVKVQNETL
jgi:bifunctional oligoribonuclease and PAP phosphatase NrnA